MIEIVLAETDEDIEVAKNLFSKSNNFVKNVLQEYNDFPWAVKYWQSCKEEVSQLPGKYGQPRACILIAMYKDSPTGCVGLLEGNGEVSIMTHLYVKEGFRGLGIGKSLVKTIIEYACLNNYKVMRLHTNLLLNVAINLYKSLGFEEVSHDRQYPEEVKDLIVNMELKLV
ncbi:MAG: GNAT family N-acetyltransferase [Planctomycetes bacterium]|nr:GNAT family N-acetyltransferase [Planctomycetota bacterium]